MSQAVFVLMCEFDCFCLRSENIAYLSHLGSSHKPPVAPQQGKRSGKTCQIKADHCPVFGLSVGCN